MFLTLKKFKVKKMEKNILMSVLLKSKEDKYYHGTFVTTKSELKFIASKNPELLLKCDGSGTVIKQRFNDFTFTVKTEDQKVIELLKERNLANGGYDLIQLLKEQGFNFSKDAA